jgi:hypothetical protein
LRPVDPDSLPLLAREPPDLADDPRELAAPERPEDDFAALLRVPLDELSSPDHLPDITRCAASATASAMIEPSRVALDIMLVAACDAVSAASKPASRIFRRAAGLALIAAAAAARPAASISLLIAAFASLSMVSLDAFERLDVFDVFEAFEAFVDPAGFWFGRLAMKFLLPLCGKDT